MFFIFEVQVTFLTFENLCLLPLDFFVAQIVRGASKDLRFFILAVKHSIILGLLDHEDESTMIL